VSDFEPADRNDDPPLEPIEQPAPKAPPVCVFCRKRPGNREGGVCASCTAMLSTQGWAPSTQWWDT
jgi:hypothetical protein